MAAKKSAIETAIDYGACSMRQQGLLFLTKLLLAFE